MFSKLFGIGALDGPAFTRLVVKMGRERGLWTDPTVDEAAMSIREGGRTMMLGNLHQVFLEVPRRERHAFIEARVLASVNSPAAPASYADAKDLLLPTVRSTGYVALVPLMVEGGDEPRIAGNLLAPGLHTSLVVDGEVSMSIVSENQLETWEVSFEEAFTHALSRLRTGSLDPFTVIAPGVWIGPWTDSYAAARILLPDLLHRVCIDPYVMVPNRETLVLADPRDPDAFDKLVSLLVEMHEQPYAISRRIFQLEGTTLREAVPPATAKLTAKYRELVLMEAAMDYGEEAERMNRRDVDVYYAALKVFELPGGEFMTRAVWTKGSEGALLPPVEEVLFVELEDDAPEAKAVHSVPWASVVEAGLLTPTDNILPRWRTGTFPGPDWLERHAAKLE